MLFSLPEIHRLYNKLLKSDSLASRIFSNIRPHILNITEAYVPLSRTIEREVYVCPPTETGLVFNMVVSVIELLFFLHQSGLH